MCTDLGPDLQMRCGTAVLPALLEAMDDFQNPRVQVSSVEREGVTGAEASLLPSCHSYLDQPIVVCVDVLTTPTQGLFLCVSLLPLLLS